MPSPRCSQCGTINFGDSLFCRRCDGRIGDALGAPPARRSWRERSAAQSALVIVVAVVGILLGTRTSLILTSNDLDWVQRERVDAAVGILQDRGFSKEAFVLAHVAHYRASDNWWNRYVGHNEAYAATNFPFEVVTLYPRFFKVADDDTERAIILLHEAQHLLGGNESAALAYVWTVKQRVGWTQDRYGATRVWRNTREWTEQSAPALFACAANMPCDSPGTR